MLCTVDEKGIFEVKGPRILHEEESRRALAVRASSSLRSFWAPLAGIIMALSGVALYVLPIAFAAGGVLGFVFLFGLVVVGVMLLVLFWISARIRNKRVEPLGAIEGALEAWAEPEGYRG